MNPKNKLYDPEYDVVVIRCVVENVDEGEISF